MAGRSDCSLKRRNDLLELVLEFSGGPRVFFELAADDFELGAWIIVVASDLPLIAAKGRYLLGSR